MKMNHLGKETSPYLLQHAHNPVEWYAWKPEAFERARREDKPILVSIGYSTCHWCHVMERESFEDAAVAEVMNENFICIKVDREERPDIDNIYMEACQLVSGNGGWPLNCFLTPEGKPFFAGTYYPPRPAHGRPSWSQVVEHLSQAFREKRAVVEEQAGRLTDMIRNADKTLTTKNSLKIENSSDFNPVLRENIFHALRERFDTEGGGFGGAPKFPSSMALQYLLEYYFYTKNEVALNHVQYSLERMIFGGIYDQLGGGFARYTVDAEWLVPHFEKMLYDNALLVSLMSEAYKLTKNRLYKETVAETLDFVMREMTPNNRAGEGFYSAYDADSEGVEGKYYVWQKAEIEAILGENAPLFCEYYDVTTEGNWEETNILNRKEMLDVFLRKKGLDTEGGDILFAQMRDKLLKERDLRIKPSLDNKILVSWNALMISGFAKAAEAFESDFYKNIAVESLDFLIENYKNTDNSWKNGSPQYAATLEDYAFVGAACIDVYNVGFDKKYLTEANAIVDFVVENFYDTDDKLFYFTSALQTDLPLRKKEIYDNATPSGNSTMLHNVLRLSVLLPNGDRYSGIFEAMVKNITPTVARFPQSFGRWSSAVLAAIHPPFELGIVGENAFEKAEKVNTFFVPNKILAVSEKKDEYLPLLENRFVENTDALIYICQNFACRKPVSTIIDFKKHIGIAED